MSVMTGGLLLVLSACSYLPGGGQAPTPFPIFRPIASATPTAATPTLLLPMPTSGPPTPTATAPTSPPAMATPILPTPTSILPPATPTPAAQPTPTPTAIPTEGSTATATPLPSIESRVYKSEKYWYSIDVPAGWALDVSNAELVIISPPSAAAIVSVEIEEIKPLRYTTVDEWIADFKPEAAAGWTDFQLTSQHRIRTSLLIKAEEYTFTYRQLETPARGILHWYIVGKYLMSVSVIADEVVWTLDTYSEVRDALARVQESFQPSSYTNNIYHYALSHPPNWDSFDDNRYDYSVRDSSTSTVLYVQVSPIGVYSNPGTYGSNQYVGATQSRTGVYAGGSISAYRMDYTPIDEATGRPLFGAVLIRFSGQNAVWVFVEGYKENWPQIQGQVEDIFWAVVVE